MVFMVPITTVTVIYKPTNTMFGGPTLQVAGLRSWDPLLLLCLYWRRWAIAPDGSQVANFVPRSWDIKVSVIQCFIYSMAISGT